MFGFSNYNDNKLSKAYQTAYEETKTLCNRLANVAKLLQRENEILRAENELLKRQSKPSYSTGTSSGVSFTPDELRRLIQLCHPDKHSGSELAQRMTQRLNQLRKG